MADSRGGGGGGNTNITLLDNMETKFDLLGKFVPAPCMVKRRNLVRLSAGGGGERKYLMNSEIKLSLGLQISGGGGLGRGEENN